MRVPPMVRILRVARPYIRNADSAGVAYLAIDDQQLAVGPIIEPADRIPVRTVIAPDLDTCLFHLGDIRILHLAAADPVDQNVHFDAGACALSERVGEGLAYGSRPVNVSLE